VAMHPVETEGAKKLFNWGFPVCALVACSLIGLQAYRSNKTQTSLENRLHQIEENTKQPPNVTVQNLVPPAQVIIGDTREKERRASARIHLGKLLDEATSFRNGCEFVGATTSDQNVKWHQWSSKVENYLERNLGSDYRARFKASENFSMNCWAGIDGQMNMLNEFLRELQ